MKGWGKKVWAYIQDNPEGYWFTRERHGYGWVPATHEGWLVTLGIVALILFNAFRVQLIGYVGFSQVLQLVVPTGMFVGLLVYICYKTGEAPHWQWKWPLRNLYKN